MIIQLCSWFFKIERLLNFDQKIINFSNIILLKYQSLNYFDIDKISYDDLSRV